MTLVVGLNYNNAPPPYINEFLYIILLMNLDSCIYFFFVEQCKCGLIIASSCIFNLWFILSYFSLFTLLTELMVSLVGVSFGIWSVGGI